MPRNEDFDPGFRDACEGKTSLQPINKSIRLFKKLMHSRWIMIRRAIVLFSFLLASATASSAQEPSGHIDLNVVSESNLTGLFVARVEFVGSDSECPEDRGMLRISKGGLRFVQTLLPRDHRLNWGWRATFHTSDDQTWQYQIESTSCRMDIAVRQQIRRDASWMPLHTLQGSGLPVKDPLKPKELTPAEKEAIGRTDASSRALHRAGSLSPSVGTVIVGFPFVDPPQTCFEASGDYQIEPTGISFSFLTGFPSDLNRFVIERTDIDANRSRLYFTRGDCRLELTVSQSVMRDGQWVSLPLAPAPLPKG